MATKWHDGEVKPTESGWYWRDTSRFGERYPKAKRYHYSTKFKLWSDAENGSGPSGFQSLPWRKGEPNE